MNLGQYFIVVFIVYTAVATPIYLLIWYFDPPLNDITRSAIFAIPIPLSMITMRKVTKWIKEKQSQLLRFLLVYIMKIIE
ncbi:hypothetical protein ACERII_10815 [Evansella sp. AB-rgal1]|uniref:hypothetical protein n=1 Tax=Evansella sp. AB-rgal1 TaxID=3242696 RepID=UPI00359EC765